LLYGTTKRKLSCTLRKAKKYRVFQNSMKGISGLSDGDSREGGEIFVNGKLFPWCHDYVYFRILLQLA
jgi:hypothetical protein